MVFSSSTYLFIVFPIIFIALFFLKKNLKLQNIWILFLSLFLYSWGGGAYVILLFISIIFNWFFSMEMDNAIGEKKRKVLFGFIILFDLFFLIFFKYSYFITSNIQSVLEIFSVDFSIPQVSSVSLPIGISFYTFSLLSYVIDIYWGKAKAQKSIIKFGVYVSLFPKLLAGPIVRYIDIEKEISDRVILMQDVYGGTKRFIIGLAKKVILANALRAVADDIFAVSGGGDWRIAWLGIICYSLQIYYDFSAYSDMAIGLGNMMGFHFMENFNYPYISRSIKEFWRRWHISLSNWFRDYVYIPLGGNRNGHTYRNLFIVFLITGLWHGASWTFVLWGVWHGIFLILERGFWGKIVDRIPNLIKHLYALFVVAFGWILFRADNIEQAFIYIRNLVAHDAYATMYFNFYLSNWNIMIITLSIVLCCPLKKLSIYTKMSNKKWFGIVSDVLTGICYISCIVFLSGTKFNPFIYFQF